MGSHTTPPTPTKITTLEVIPSCDGPSLKIEQTEYTTIWTNYDVTGFDLVGSYVDFEMGGAFGPVEAVYWEPSVTSLDPDGVAHGPFNGRIFIEGHVSLGGDTMAKSMGNTGVHQVGTGQSEKS